MKRPLAVPFTAVALLMLVGCSALQSQQRSGDSPYAGQQVREIKALDPERVAGLLAGSGLGYAKAAELNRYPGPAHVLELTDQLALSDEQLTQTEALFAAMQARTSALGAQLVENERLLDKRFADAQLDDAALRELVAASARIEGEIRAEHLATHLAQRALLSDEQVETYIALRGYDKPGGHTGHKHH